MSACNDRQSKHASQGKMTDYQIFPAGVKESWTVSNADREGPDSTERSRARRGSRAISSQRRTAGDRCLLLCRSCGGLNLKPLRVEDVIKPADHHLLPGLRSPTHFFRGIGIVLVMRGVVEVGHALQPAPFGQE